MTPPRSRLRPGDVLSDRYEVRRLLGHGAMGTVYQVYDRTLDETVALKTLGERAGSEETLRFRSEIKLARKVSHPNVCRIYEYGEDGSHRFISMEFVDGLTIKERLRSEGPLPVAEACEVVRQAAEALQAIHEAGIIHRDLKTLNLMQDAAGRVRVMDFGIAKPRQAEATNASEGYTLGTPEYMSPEQARGQALDHRSDVYSLGIVLFELVTGSVPFSGDSPAEILSRQMHEPPLEGAAGARVPPALQPVLRRALAKQADARFGSARELAEALRDLPSVSEPVGPSLQSAPITVTLPRARRRTPLEPWLGVAALLAIVASVVHLGGRGPERDARPASPPLAPPVAAAATPGTPSRHSIAGSRAAKRSAPGAVEGRAVRYEVVEAPPVVVPARDVEHLPAFRMASDPEPPPAAEPPEEAPAVAAEPKGRLKLGVRPWGEVFLNGVHQGTAPMGPLDLPPGVYTAFFIHPQYGHFQRKVTVFAGQTTPVQVDLSQLGTWE